MTDEQKQEVEERKKRRAERRDREIEEFLGRLSTMSRIISDVYSRVDVDKYHGVYDEYGFPRI